MIARLPHQRTAHMTHLYLSDPKHLKKFLREFKNILKSKYQIINDAGEDRYTCGQQHDHRNPNWKPFQYFEQYCLQEGLDDFEVRDFLEKYLHRRIICECHILIDEKAIRKRHLMRQFGVDFEGVELVD